MRLNLQQKTKPQMAHKLAAVILAAIALIAMSVPRETYAQKETVSAAEAPRRAGACRFSSFTQIEPDAGSWKTWVLESPRQIPLSAPPYAPEEIAELRQFEVQRDAAILDQISYWDTGGPAYRWNEIAFNQLASANNNRIARAMALINVAIYDAMIAAWDAKYLHQRPRPIECVPSLKPAVMTPQSPSYPSEHAVAAGAASAILAYLLPNNAKFLNDQAEAAALSRIYAGVNYRSDITAGLELGRAVAALLIARARTDGSDAVFSGTIPTGPCNWKGTNPVEPLGGTWRTWVLTSGSELRPGPPPACGSEQFLKELAEVRDFPRPIPTTAASFPQTRAAYFWQGPTIKLWDDILGTKLLQYELGSNPPREARAYALFHIAGYDSSVAAWDAKYTYWHIRPSQFDPSIRTLFAVPNHPSYPSAHAIYDGSYVEVLSYLFPRDEAFFRAQAQEAAQSRIWAGIHYKSDIEGSTALSREVGRRVIAWARSDGSK